MITRWLWVGHRRLTPSALVGTIGSADVGMPEGRRLGNLGERDTFVDQHDRNVFADGVENLTVGANQAPVELFRDGFSALFFSAPRSMAPLTF